MSNINEASFSDADIPKRFFVSIFFDPRYHADKLEQIGNLELKNIQGISGTNKNLLQWFGIAREAALIMDSNEVIRLNKLTKIMYDNPHYLVSNNMSAIFRLFDKKDRGNGIDNLIHNLSDSILGTMKKSSNKIWKSLAEYRLESLYRSMDSKKKINNLTDFINFVENSLKQNLKSEYDINPLSDNDYKEIAISTLKQIGKIYKEEQEWRLKDNVLKVPQGSTLLILIPEIPKDIYEKWKNNSLEQVNKFIFRYELEKFEEILRSIKEYDLNNKYNIKLVSNNKFSAGKKKYYNSFVDRK
jgi:hypothetical protein